MKIVVIGNQTTLIANEGMAVRPKSSHDPIVESVTISPSDDPDNWEDCEREDPSQDEPTMEDKDEALRRFGVEV